LNPRPLGYEPSELPNCSTPRRVPLLYELLATKANQRDAAGGVAEAGGGRA
jgi:hypothetical protein